MDEARCSLSVRQLVEAVQHCQAREHSAAGQVVVRSMGVGVCLIGIECG